MKEDLREESIEELIVDVDNPITINYSQVFDTCMIVQLETSKDRYIGDIDRLIYGKENLVILDNSKSKSIFIYGLDGHLKNVIHREGKGPGEYIFPANIRLSENEQEIYVYDSRHSKLIRYTIEGEFLEELIIEDRKTRFHDFIIKGDGFYMTRAYPEKWSEKLHLTNKSFESKMAINTSLPGDLMLVNGMKSQFFYQKYDGNGFLYKEWLNNKILAIEEDSISRVLSVSFTRNMLAYEKDITHDAKQTFTRLFKGGYFAPGEDIIDSRNFMMFNFMEGNKGRLAIWDKKRNSTYYIKGIENDMDELLPDLKAIPPKYNTSANMLITVLPPYLFNEMVAERQYEGNPYDPLVSKISVGEFDNPILLIYKLKDTLVN